MRFNSTFNTSRSYSARRLSHTLRIANEAAPAPASTNCIKTVGRRGVCTRPWYLHWRRPQYEDTSLTNRVAVFCRASEVRFAKWYRQPRSRQWCAVSFCCDWMTAMACLPNLVRRLHGWFFSYVAPTTSLTHLSVFTGCASRSAQSLKSPRDGTSLFIFRNSHKTHLFHRFLAIHTSLRTSDKRLRSVLSTQWHLAHSSELIQSSVQWRTRRVKLTLQPCYDGID